MKKIFILSGKTMAGKTTISNILKNEHGIDRIISFTTRPARENEIDGVDYNFYTDTIAQVLITQGKASAVRSYQPHISFGPYPWYYGFETKKILDEENPFLITDLKGIIDLKKQFGEDNVFVIYLDILREEQEKRIKDRDLKLADEQLRRIEADILDFEGIENYADHIVKISNKKANTIAKEIAKIIEKNA